ncbi:MAG: glutamine-hydrolyzing carbamoyl-phosphate synthase small subunit [Bifidobacteriaceae bacterium]|jgi:carbamoyl-phosphate synthase small subunit|nr:glutamine-hydrolyzing carbamoyl-phosphate synthase small subunit [Bifidobacteriaceae bacterium]
MRGFLVLESGDVFVGEILEEYAGTTTAKSDGSSKTGTNLPKDEPSKYGTTTGKTDEPSKYSTTNPVLAELVFTTGMSGYQETLTDPSYAGQMICFTAPHIGNTGVNSEDIESIGGEKIYPNAIILKEKPTQSSSWRSENEFSKWLAQNNTVCLYGVDTRKLTLILREYGSLKAGIFSGVSLINDAKNDLPNDAIDIVRNQNSMEGSKFVDEVSVKSVTNYPSKIGKHSQYCDLNSKQNCNTYEVALIDLGIKANSINNLNMRGCNVTVFPNTTNINELTQKDFDGVFFSNGPGDPATAINEIALLSEVLKRKIPYFGICMGNQLLTHALGFSTKKMKFGHRGINQPVKEVETSKVYITAHNHGFASNLPLSDSEIQAGKKIKSPKGFGDVIVSHYNLNDNVIEGIKCLDIPAFSVQYHPEAAAGPHDAENEFDKFIDLMRNNNVPNKNAGDK